VLAPGEWWNGPRWNQSDFKYLAIETAAGADVLAITDSDADGHGTATVLKEAFPDKDVAHVVSGHGKRTINPMNAIDTFIDAAQDNIDIYLTDMCLDPVGSEEAEDASDHSDALPDLATMVDKLEQLGINRTLHLYDHHEWSDEAVQAFSRVVDDFRVISAEGEDEVCATNITFDALEDRIKRDNPEAYDRLAEFVAVTRDHDIWRKEDPRSDDLSDYQFNVDSEQYVEATRRFGANIADDPDIAAELDRLRFSKKAKMHASIAHARWFKFADGTLHRLDPEWRTRKRGPCWLADGETDEYADPLSMLPALDLDTWAALDGVTIAYIYGDSYHSGALDQLITGDIENGDGAILPAGSTADIGYYHKPWNKGGFRTADAFPVANDIGQTFPSGGGHAHAAGGCPDVVGTTRLVDLREHWATAGSTAGFAALQYIVHYLATQWDCSELDEAACDGGEPLSSPADD
jgi:oligoribonuclease NrnB/cAMP/cGMP phosphodiesterase (DHH superfamily)